MFVIDNDVPFPYFEQTDIGVQQNLPLRLKDQYIENQLFHFLQRYEEVLKKLNGEASLIYSKKHKNFATVRRTF